MCLPPRGHIPSRTVRRRRSGIVLSVSSYSSSFSPHSSNCPLWQSMPSVSSTISVTDGAEYTTSFLSGCLYIVLTTIFGLIILFPSSPSIHFTINEVCATQAPSVLRASVTHTCKIILSFSTRLAVSFNLSKTIWITYFLKLFIRINPGSCLDAVDAVDDVTVLLTLTRSAAWKCDSSAPM